LCQTQRLIGQIVGLGSQRQVVVEVIRQVQADILLYVTASVRAAAGWGAMAPIARKSKDGTTAMDISDASAVDPLLDARNRLQALFEANPLLVAGHRLSFFPRQS
jgi:hypothetical protein